LKGDTFEVLSTVETSSSRCHSSASEIITLRLHLIAETWQHASSGCDSSTVPFLFAARRIIFDRRRSGSRFVTSILYFVFLFAGNLFIP
jgi:hypothetical protein